MGNKQLSRSGVNYFDDAWNPVKAAAGGTMCTKVSPGCLNCWAGELNHRFHPEEPLYNYNTTGLNFVLDLDVLDAPIRKRKPSIIGVQFMSDLFHEDVTDEMLDEVFAHMVLATHQTFLVLTKRPERMRDYLGYARIGEDRIDKIGEQCICIDPSIKVIWGLPLSNVWLGVSVENQETANERIPILLQTPAARRWVSVEPMLGPVDLGYTFASAYQNAGGKAALDWIVCGCESGRGHRPMDPDWVRSLRDQCVAARVPFWFKQTYEGNKLIQLPMLDGRQWKERP